MARTIQRNGSEHSDQAHDKLTFQAQGHDKIDLPSSDFIADAKMTREGNDLVLESPQGETAVIEGYFSADPTPLLHAPDGSVLTPNLVDAFAHSPAQFAANASASDQSPVGAVEEVKGNATVTHADGTKETITNGTPIYQGDVVETDASGAVNIVFVDETSMAISAGARFAIDEYTYDPKTESGTTNFSVLRGLFVFTSGLIGRDDPDDVKIDTPVGSIGIRGTIIAGEINPGGESNITVMEGAIVVKNGHGEFTLSQQFETVRLHGFEAPMHNVGVVPASEINTRFHSVSDVNPSLFTMIDDAVREQAHTPTPEAPKMDATPEQPTSSNDQPQQQPAAQQSGTSSETQVNPVVTTAPAPDALAPIDGSVASLSTTGTTGLPSSNTIVGQPPSGLTGTTITTTAAASAPPPSSTLPPAPITSTSTTGTIPPATDTTTAPPPSVIGNTGTTGTTGPAITMTGGTFNDIMAANTSLGNIDAGRTGVTYSFAAGSNVNGYYAFLANGTGVELVLTAAGHNALANSLETVDLGDPVIVATDTATGAQTTQTFNTTITDANAGRILNLNADTSSLSDHITLISDGYNNAGHLNSFGYTISALGDINNDGFADFVVSNNSDEISQNHVYLFTGSAAEWGNGALTDAAISPHFTTINNPTSPGTNPSETVVSGIGDFNGDGMEDYVVGQAYADSSTLGTGNAAIVNGANPTQSLKFFSGLGTNAEVGYALDGIGDFNNDGFADVIIGAPAVERAYFIAGHAESSWTAPLPTAQLITGVTNSRFGEALAGLGDFNGDGYSDFAIGSPVYDAGSNTDDGKISIYGGNSATNQSNLIGSVVGNAGDQFGTDVFSIGDVNGDGKTDMLISSLTGGSLVFGTNSAAIKNIDFNVPATYQVVGGGGVGDFNGDGYDDFTISLANASGSKTYMVFGKDFPTNANYDLNFFKDPANALELQYNGVTSSSEVKISSLGDVNGDGYDDFAIGVPDANGAAAGNGGMYLMYGHSTGGVSTGVTTATANNQSLVGGAGADTLSDGTATGFMGISMRGGAGNDTFAIHNTDFLGIDGGGQNPGGMDRILMKDNLDFSSLDYEKISGIEAVQFGDVNQTLTLTLENIFNLLKSSDTGSLRIDTSMAGSILNIDAMSVTGTGGNNTTGDTNIANALNEMGNGAVHEAVSDAVGYRQFSIGGYDLYITDNVNLTVNVV